jgi:menaquinone-dependent protoporphyrinogen IX oxidase
MKAIVVYESLWGNTAAIARAIAEGIGPEARALSTAEATAVVTADADLIVAGAPLHAFRLSTDKIRDTLSTKKDEKAPTPPNLSHPSMRTWLASIPKGKGKASAFETRFKWSPGGAAGSIMGGLKRAGYSKAAKPRKFLVAGIYGPLKNGEVERAKAWGGELGKLIK